MTSRELQKKETCRSDRKHLSVPGKEQERCKRRQSSVSSPKGKKAGSIAEAALALNVEFEAVQSAADQYWQSVKPEYL